MRCLVSICLLAVGLFVGACASEDELDDLILEEELEGELGKADAFELPLRFLPGNLALPTHTLHDEVRRVFKTEDELEDALQIGNPGIDFSQEWAVFYNPGLAELLPGSRARIDTVSLSQTGLTLKVTTAIEHNGADCPTRSTRPFLLVAVPIPADPPPHLRRYRADRTRSCSDQYDGVPFTTAEAEGALAAANEATADDLGAVGITGTQLGIIIEGRPWASLGEVAATFNIGPATMAKLRTLSEDFE